MSSYNYLKTWPKTAASPNFHYFIRTKRPSCFEQCRDLGCRGNFALQGTSDPGVESGHSHGAVCMLNEHLPFLQLQLHRIDFSLLSCKARGSWPEWSHNINLNSSQNYIFRKSVYIPECLVLFEEATQTSSHLPLISRIWATSNFLSNGCAELTRVWWSC